MSRGTISTIKPSATKLKLYAQKTVFLVQIAPPAISVLIVTSRRLTTSAMHALQGANCARMPLLARSVKLATLRMDWYASLVSLTVISALTLLLAQPVREASSTKTRLAVPVAARIAIFVKTKKIAKPVLQVTSL